MSGLLTNPARSALGPLWRAFFIGPRPGPGARPAVPGPGPVVRGPWCMVRVAWCMVPGPWAVVRAEGYLRPFCVVRE